ncbi:MAG: polysaccharide ABC transporter ATP-binding protein [Nitrospiraceae bacterium]|nr:polysaccharide ABC transporter ATP-binding protein [Nitrospiraceae bacterium]MDA8388808.1 polysaccharide ABC transporter ATP-binding protein [Nitrospiraceae bacterium]
MSGIAIRLDNICKKYRIGRAEQNYRTLRDAIKDALAAPFRKTFRLLAGRGAEKAKAHDEIWALKDICFEVRPGEVMGVIGRNGAGKSTLLKILSRITEPTRGYAEIQGRVGSLLEVGTGFHAELTGRENIYLNGAILGMARIEIKRKFDEIVAFSEVEKFIDTPVKHYSSGMYLRLAFAVAAHLEPEILIVDEVLAVGDARFQKKCLNKMEDVGHKGRTVLFVSHNMPAVTRLCKRAILLEEGILKTEGPSYNVVGSYLNSGHCNAAVREWSDPSKAPGNDIVRLRAIRVRTAEGRIAETVNISETFAIDMEYDVLQPGCFLMPWHHFFNGEGIRLFEAHDTDAAWLRRERPAGHYVSTVWIYGNLLAEGIIYVSSGLTRLQPTERMFHERDSAVFQVVDHDSNSPALGGWTGTMEGAVRPFFQWTTRLRRTGEKPAI